MLILKQMTWANMFSYGETSSIDFSKDTVTQIVGTNGAGKSSIPLVLEELLFNKNSKGIKKGEVVNRYSGKEGYNATLSFSDGSDEYTISLIRKGASSKVFLEKNGEDISSHTATGTYKSISEIVGDDFTVFSRKIYQGMTSSLQFLTDTDSNRKKFLISLLDLSEYSGYEQTLKEISLTITGELRVLEKSVDELQNWLSESSKVSTESKDLQELPDTPKILSEKLAELRSKLANANKLNNEYSLYNKTTKELESIESFLSTSTPEEGETIEEVEALVSKLIELKSPHTSIVNKLSSLNGKCPTCLSEIDEDKISQMLNESKTVIEKCNDEYTRLNKRLSEAKERKEKIRKITQSQEQKERLQEQIKVLNSDKVDTDLLEVEISNIEKEVSDIYSSIKQIQLDNSKSIAHNARVKEILSQKDTIKVKVDKSLSRLKVAKEERAIIDVLKKAFSPKGIVAYKMESMVKDLEDEINNYLIEFSDGRFSLNFILQGDKLNVIITDEGKEVNINALSSGEQARVNISTVLAIRKIMNTMSKNNVNLLVLDEIVSVLDQYGRDKLIEILNKEHSLNTFIISHGWRHPLVPQLLVEKKNKISEITVNV